MCIINVHRAPFIYLIKHFLIFVVLDEGKVYHWGYGPACGCNENIFTPTEVISLYSERIEKVAAGDSHSLALSSYGILFAWGDNSKVKSK